MDERPHGVVYGASSVISLLFLHVVISCVNTRTIPVIAKFKVVLS